MNLYFEDRGQGKAVVLLHGFTGSSGDWLPFLPMLPGSFRYIIPDLRGHGRSPNPDRTYTHGQSATDVLELLEHLGIERFRVVGVSGGAMTSLHIATREPTRVESMVLVSPTTHYPEQARQIMGAVDPENQPEEEWAAMRQRHPQGDDQIKGLWRQSNAFKDDYDDMSFQPADLQRIRARTFIVHGEADPLFPIEIAQGIERDIPNASFWVIPGGGHVPVFGDAMNEFFERTSRFLTSHEDSWTTESISENR